MTGSSTIFRFHSIQCRALLHQVFSALQCLASTDSDGVGDPVSLLLTSNQVLLFENIEMVGKF